MQNSAYRKLLNLNISTTHFVYISIKSLTKTSKLLKMLRNWGLKETAISYEQTLGFTGNRWQNISQKVRKSQKTGQGQKRLISAFELVLIVVTKN